MKGHVLFIAGTILLLAACSGPAPENRTELSVTIDAQNGFQTVDGFGVNITPAQWRDGNLKPVLDRLVDDLGCTLFRFDCTGLADWLDPAKRDKNGTYPAEYLKQVYTNKIFRDSWETFRYLNAKGVEPIFNVSGRIPAGLGRKDDLRRLADFDGFAEMAVTMLKWAREEEKLKFTRFMPFNETDLGYPEGPKIEPEDVLRAVRAIVKKLDRYGLSDVQLIVMDDASVRFDKVGPILNAPEFKGRIQAFGFHTYGNGDEAEGIGWFNEPSAYENIAGRIRGSAYSDCPVWMTEYGDLDQTGLIEREFAWRSTRRLLKCLNEGFSAGIAWDAFDNFHEHDGAWAVYGLLATDTAKWTYAPKSRYFAAKQVYRYVKPGFVRAELKPAVPDQAKKDVYAVWHDACRHVPMAAFVSPDRKDFTIVGMSRIEGDVPVTFSLQGFNWGAVGRPVLYFRTGKGENCQKVQEIPTDNTRFKAVLKERTIFTFTTVK
jgi:O-glycosyl hydrolase